MKISLIVAMDQERGIGKNNDLMWHLPADMKFFKETTQGHIVVMGRKNYESIPEKFRPLPNRENVVLTRNKNFNASNCQVFYSLEDCFSHYSNKNEEKTVFIIGGGEIYKMALESNLVSEMYITHVQKKYDADTFFPSINETTWKIETISTHEKDEKNEASFEIKKYTKK